MARDLLAYIESQMNGFSKGQKLIGRYIVDHYDKAAFMTAAKLGEAVGVSESTVVRFASEVGFEGYPQLQRALQELIQNKLTAVQRMEITNEQIGNEDVLQKVLNLDIEKIRRTLEETSAADFDSAVEAITRARKVYIIGVRSAAALAQFMSFYCNLILRDVRLVSTSSVSEMFEQILRIDENDVLVAISFPRYSRRTVQATQYASRKKAKVVAVTDSRTSPLVEKADSVLLARSDMVSFVDSLAAPLSLINALIVAVGLSKREEISESFAKLEQIWEDYDVYEKIEGNQSDGII
ncbi:MurR/RpiR family transcriptional regulator [Candidatus Soleaferrea massiliensis]|uniref:MurR/RpiR family transcriptional regulator n=1 Tax=Candidatus Soleaferrea massiliensis TaxID=1470354 RepID=UPI0005901FAF|nr:MurR/RpiR family transcriptional regulator [Candidatus Soleaferrea massiliensis]